MAQPPVEKKDVEELQARLERLKADFTSGKVKGADEARRFLEEISTLAQQIAELGSAVVTGDEAKRQQLDEHSKSIQQLLKHLPNLKG